MKINPDWKPIETAPKDREILAFSHDTYEFNDPILYGPWSIRWNDMKPRGWVSSWNGDRVIRSESCWGTEYYDLDLEPTHWMDYPVTFIKDE